MNSRTSWTIVTLLFFFSMINFFDKLVIGIAAVPIMRDLHLTPGQFGIVASSFYSLYAISGLLVGLFLVDRIRTKWLLVLLVALWSVSQLPIVMGTTVAALISGRVLLGIGEGPATPSAYEVTYGWFTNDRRDLPTSVLLQGISFGFIVGAPLLSYVIAEYGWRAGFILCGALGLLWMLAWMALGADGPLSTFERPSPPRASADAAAHADETRISWKRFWLDPTMIGTLLVASSAYWLTGISVSWLPAYLQVGLGYDAKTAGWLVSVILGANIVLLFVISFASRKMRAAGLSSRVSRGLVNGIAVLLGGAAMVLATIVSDAVVRVVLLTLAFELPQISFVLGPAIVGEIAPRPQRAPALLITYSVITVMAFFSPIVMGYVVEAAGPGNALLGYTRGLWIVSAILVVGGGAGCLLLDPEATLRRFARGHAAEAAEQPGLASAALRPHAR